MKAQVVRFGMAFLLIGGIALGLIGDEPKKPAEKPKEFVPTDITADVKSWNSNKFIGPPTEFRKGHVTPKELDAKALSKTDLGYVIQLPSKAPIPTPTVYDGKVYVSGGFHSKEFYCFDAESGKLVWGINLDDDGPTAAVCHDGVAVFNTESCTLFAVDAKTGKQLWSLWLGDPLTSTPTIAGGVVFTSYPARRGGVGQMGNPPANNVQQGAQAPKREEKPAEKGKDQPPCSHVLAAFELKTGKILWQRWIDSDVMSAPVAVDDEIYATSFAGTVYKFKQKDGAIVSAVKSRATSAPVVVGKEVYMTNRADDGKGDAQECITNVGRYSNRVQYEANKKPAVYLDDKVQSRSAQKAQGGQLDAANGFAGGAPQAANPDAAKGNVGQDNVSTMQAFQGSRILWMDNNNYNCMGDELIATEAKSGKKLWSFKIDGDLKKEGGFLAAPPAAAAGQLFLTTLNGNVLQVDPKDGKITKTHKVGSQVRFQPAIEGGRIFVGTQDGKLVCINTGDAKLTGWPCWGGNPQHTGIPAMK